jgi:EAL domain-containing protein (putative c-di-GMP-specific phosphodiesterase class I)
MRSVLASTPLPPHLLELELTESVLMRDSEAMVQNLHQLKLLGVRLALDDFGTGYSSLSYLKRFPIDVIKIDQSFTFEVCTDDGAASITRAIIAMAQSLKLKTVAEGVETPEQLEFLSALGCDSMQGHYLERPMPGAQMTSYLERMEPHISFSHNTSAHDDAASPVRSREPTPAAWPR